MIKIIDGDLLEAKEDVIGHQVNCQGKMGSGVADQIKKKWDVVYLSYTLYLKTIIDPLGDCEIVPVEENKWVANLYGQDNYGYDGKQYTDVFKLTCALKELKDLCKKHNKSVALPYKIGCDRGGANWDEVYQIIEEIFSDYEVTLYKYNKK